MSKSGCTWRRGLSLVEVVGSTLIVTLMIVTALNLVGASAAAGQTQEERGRGMILAQTLMAEILRQEYIEPGSSSATLGPEAGETGASRSAFDDVDDYHGLSEQPKSRAGVTLPNSAGWNWSVQVQYDGTAQQAQSAVTVKINLLGVVVLGGSTDTGAKQVRVTVSYGGKPVAALISLRTRGEGTLDAYPY